MNVRNRPLGPCLKCAKPMVFGTVKKPPRGKVAHKSRRLCRGCFAWAEYNDRLQDYPMIYRRRQDLINAAADLGEIGMKRLEICRYLGVSRDAFERAHQRAKVRMVPV
jgi:hypothetical protein